jgi:hypothetical protein
MAMRTGFSVILLFSLLGNPLRAQSVSRAEAWDVSPSLSVGGFAGYQRGLSFQVWGTAEGFATGLPVQVRLRLGRTGVEAGNAGDARRVFINDATNGTPRESGRTWDFGLDGLYAIGPRTNVFGGLRYARFKANFRFVGGNEDFDVTSSHWGLAAGAETSYPMGRRTALILTGGLEYFLSSRLTGHDTSYSPDGDDVNPRLDYTYHDADQAVGQPTWRPLLLIGVKYQLGM